MVQEWLRNYMLRNDPDAAQKAETAAEWFANYEYFGSHGRRVSLADIRALGLNATALEADNDLQDAVLSVHHAYALTMSNTGTVKVTENHLGKAYVKLVQMVLQQGPGAPITPPVSLPPAQPSRAERRRTERR
jgi:hypothetical protein